MTAPADAPFLAACRGEPTPHLPVWFMRQAGRSLPEYRAIRGDGTILDAIAKPELAAELTLQPVRRHGVDAAILYSDIVVPVAAIGFGVDVAPGTGPVIDQPFRSPADLQRLRPLEPELDTHVEIPQTRADVSQLVLDHLPDSRALLHHEQRLGTQLLERHRLAGEPVAARACEHDLVAEERLVGDAAMTRSGADDTELELALRDLCDDGLRVGDRETNAHVRVQLLELAQQERHDGPARSCGCAQFERPAQRTLRIAGHVLEQLLLEGQQLLRRRVEPEAGLRRLDPSPRAVEQLRPEPLLERPNLEADRGLGHAEPLGGLGEALSLDDRAERSQLTGVHKRPLCKRRRLSIRTWPWGRRTNRSSSASRR